KALRSYDSFGGEGAICEVDAIGRGIDSLLGLYFRCLEPGSRPGGLSESAGRGLFLGGTFALLLHVPQFPPSMCPNPRPSGLSGFLLLRGEAGLSTRQNKRRQTRRQERNEEPQCRSAIPRQASLSSLSPCGASTPTTRTGVTPRSAPLSQMGSLPRPQPPRSPMTVAATTKSWSLPGRTSWKTPAPQRSSPGQLRISTGPWPSPSACRTRSSPSWPSGPLMASRPMPSSSSSTPGTTSRKPSTPPPPSRSVTTFRCAGSPQP